MPALLRSVNCVILLVIPIRHQSVIVVMLQITTTLVIPTINQLVFLLVVMIAIVFRLGILLRLITIQNTSQSIVENIEESGVAVPIVIKMPRILAYLLVPIVTSIVRVGWIVNTVVYETMYSIVLIAFRAILLVESKINVKGMCI